MTEKKHGVNNVNSDALKNLRRTPKVAGGKSDVAQKKTPELKPTHTLPLRAAQEEADRIEELKKIIPGGRKKKPEPERRKHQVPVYLTDGELELLEARAAKHYIKAGKMLRILIDSSGILE